MQSLRLGDEPEEEIEEEDPFSNKLMTFDVSAVYFNRTKYNVKFTANNDITVKVESSISPIRLLS